MISAWKKAVRSIQNQIHYSHSHDPYLNLAVEHYLLTNSPKDSNVLFLYRNSPSIVIGRNQNPWLEVNHVALRSKSRINGNDGAINPQPSLVRRRSGGGTVYHDLNNLNYCAICPPADFKRDKHAEMLVRAIRPFNARARVNQRHDVVLDQGQSQGLSSSDVEKSIDEQDTHSTPYQSSLPPLKISGSAFKIIRDRALHHGTCILQLLNSSNFRDLLDSPARGFIDAFGVESVRSPVGAVFGSGAPDDHSAKFTRQTHLELVRNIMAEFCQMYSIDKTNLRAFDRDESLLSDEKLVWSDPKETFAACYVKEAHEDVEEIREGVNDLKSEKWLWQQTPRFSLSSHPDLSTSTSILPDKSNRPTSINLPSTFPPAARVHLKANHGAFTDIDITLSSSSSLSSSSYAAAEEERAHFTNQLHGKNIHEIDDFVPFFRDHAGRGNEGVKGAGAGGVEVEVGRWLNCMFGK